MKFAIVGAGAIGLEHIRNIQILDGSQVTAVADPVEKSQKFRDIVTFLNILFSCFKSRVNSFLL